MMRHFIPSSEFDKATESKILIVDTDIGNIKQVAKFLADSYVTFTALSCQQAIEFCLKTPPDLVLMDIMMPAMDGLTTCQKMKQHPNLQDIPVIFLTDFHKPAQENACWEVGGTDVLFKPVNPVTLRKRVQEHFRLKLQTELLSDLVYQDGLTGIYNRRYFDNYYAQQLGQAKRTCKPLALLMIDVDFFKQYNDIYGHAAGDVCLKTLSQCLQSILLRPADILARYGGEEFVCVLPDTDTHGACFLAHEMLEAVAGLAIPHRASPNHFLSISVGIGVSQECGPEDLIKQADTQLYKAKENGRNCCM
jgi:diguanylate cyclase (GGDEF)-like protein